MYLVFHLIINFLFLYSKQDQEILISLPLTSLNPDIRNEIFSKHQFNIIELKVDDDESRGIHIKLGISTTIDSPLPFSSSIIYNKLNSSFSELISYDYNLEILYLIKLKNNKTLSFSCQNLYNINDILCGFYRNNIFVFMDNNNFEKELINFNNGFGNFLLYNENILVHYMSYNNSVILILLKDINFEEIKFKINVYKSYDAIKCIYFNEDGFFCVFVKKNNITNKINIKYFNINEINFEEDFNNDNNINQNNTNKEYSKSLRNFLDNYIDNDIGLNYNKGSFLLNDSLSFKMNLINNYAFDIYIDEQNIIIVCFLINEDNLQSVKCYKNCYQELIKTSLIFSKNIYSSIIKRDGNPKYFDYSKIKIITSKENTLKVMISSNNGNNYLIVDLISLSAYISNDNTSFILSTLSNPKQELYILNYFYLTTKNKKQILNLVITHHNSYITTELYYSLKPNLIYDKFILEEKLGEIELLEPQDLFILSEYSKENYHTIELKNIGEFNGTYKYKNIPLDLTFSYKFIIHPGNCLTNIEPKIRDIKNYKDINLLPNGILGLGPEDIIPYYYWDYILGNYSKCDDHCYHCAMLKADGNSKCIVCDENYTLNNYKCVEIENCPIDAYFYSYKKTINISGEEIDKNITACNEVCEDEYTGYFLEDNESNKLNKICVLNKYKNLDISVEDFLNLDKDEKQKKINDTILNIKEINNITTNEDYKNLVVEFILLNEYISNYIKPLKEEIIILLNETCDHYFNITEEYFSSASDEYLLLNNSENFIYFIASLSSLFNNKEYLNQTCLDKIHGYIYLYSNNLVNYKLTASDIDKINAILYIYTKYLNISLDTVKADDNLDLEKFNTDEFYRYQNEILFGEESTKLMEITNNIIKFLMSIENLNLCQNNYIYFYNQKLSENSNDIEIKMSKLGLEIYILGTDTDKTMNSFTINSILDSIDNGLIDNYKIIIPPLKSMNNNINWNEAFFNMIIFNGKYPILNSKSIPYVSPNFFDINFYDKNGNIIKIENLKENNLIKIIKKKSYIESTFDTCVFYDNSVKNLNDKDIKSYDLIEYLICATSHLTSFTLSSFSPSLLLTNLKNNKELSEEETIRNSRWIKDVNMLERLNKYNATILYINVGIFTLCILLFIIKFLLKTEVPKSEESIDDSYIRYTINEDTESDKKILKYLIEKEIEFILKNQSDYEKQKRQELALNSKNEIFNTDQQVITIIEDGSDDDDEEEDFYNDKRLKKVSFKDNTNVNDNKKNKNIYNNKAGDYSTLNRTKSLARKTKYKKAQDKSGTNVEMINIIKEDYNDFIENDDDKEDEDDNAQSKKYKYFNYKNNLKKSNITSSVSTSNRHSTFANLESYLNRKRAKTQKKVKKQSMNERFRKCLKEQKSRLIYSIMDKTLSEYKSTGQNGLDIPTNIIKRPVSMIEISNALNKVNNKKDEKILIKNEFFVVLKLILYILYQYEYRFICFFNKIILPISRNNLIFLTGLRFSIQLSLSAFLSPRYFGNNYSFSENILSIFLTLIICDIIFTILEIILMKKKISTSTDNKLKSLIKFKQILECIIGYILALFIGIFGLYHSTMISLYLEQQKIECRYIINYIVVILADYLLYENIIIVIKGFIMTYAVYQDIEGCGLKFLEIFNKVFIFYLAE